MLKTAKNEFEIVLPEKRDTLNSKQISVNPILKKFNPDLEQQAIDLASEGKTIKSICEILNCDNYAITSYLKNNPLFKKSFEEARSDGHEALADSLIDIAEKEPDILRARVKSENIKWLLSKRKATVYGDKLEVNMNATVDIGSALAEARSRAFNAANDTEAKSLSDLLS